MVCFVCASVVAVGGLWLRWRNLKDRLDLSSRFGLVLDPKGGVGVIHHGHFDTPALMSNNPSAKSWLVRHKRPNEHYCDITLHQEESV